MSFTIASISNKPITVDALVLSSINIDPIKRTANFTATLTKSGNLVSTTRYNWSSMYITQITTDATNLNISNTTSYTITLTYYNDGTPCITTIISKFPYYTNGLTLYYDPINPSNISFIPKAITYTVSNFNMVARSGTNIYTSLKGFYTFTSTSILNELIVQYVQTAYQYTMGYAVNTIDLIYSDGHAQIIKTIQVTSNDQYTFTSDQTLFKPTGNVKLYYINSKNNASFTSDSTYIYSKSELTIRCVPTYIYSGIYKTYPVARSTLTHQTVIVTDPYSLISNVSATFISNIGTTFSGVSYKYNNDIYTLYNITASNATFSTIYSNQLDLNSFSFEKDDDSNYNSLISYLNNATTTTTTTASTALTPFITTLLSSVTTNIPNLSLIVSLNTITIN